MLYSKVESMYVHVLLYITFTTSTGVSFVQDHLIIPFFRFLLVMLPNIYNSYTQCVTISLYESSVLETHHMCILFITELSEQ